MGPKRRRPSQFIVFRRSQICDILKWMVVNAVGKKYSEADRAYLAGFIDADGAIMAYIEPHREKKFKFRIRLEIKVTQKEQATLAHLCEEYGKGVIVKNRSTYDWRIRTRSDVVSLLHLIHPYSVAKQRQVNIALQIAEGEINSKEDLLRIAKLADTLARFNVRSANRRKNHTSKIQEYFSRND